MALNKNQTVWQRTRNALIRTGMPHTDRELDAWTDAVHSYVIDERREVGMSGMSLTTGDTRMNQLLTTVTALGGDNAPGEHHNTCWTLHAPCLARKIMEIR